MWRRCKRKKQRIKELHTRYEGARDALLALEPGQRGEQQRLAEIARIDAALQKPFKEALGQALAFDGEGAIKTIVTQIDPLNQAALAEMDQLVAQANAATKAVLTEAAGQRPPARADHAGDQCGGDRRRRAVRLADHAHHRRPAARSGLGRRARGRAAT